MGQAAWCPDRARVRAQGLGLVDLVTDRDLEQQLARARRVKLPEWVLFAPNEDAFALAAGPDRRREILAMMRRLLQAGIGLALTTRADLRDGQGLVDLARAFPDSLTVRVGVFGVDPRLEEKWERGLAPSARRLALARALKEAGARVEVELGPIIPFANDDARELHDTVRAVARAGIDVVAPRWIEDAPGLDRQIEVEVTPSTARLVTGWFRQPGSNKGGASRRILPLQVRRSRLEHIEAAAAQYKVRVAACACSDAGACVSCLEGHAGRATPQLELFG